MKTLFDTSVIVAATVASHPQHSPARAVLDRALSGELAYHVCTHTIAELYAVLTSLPVRPRITARLARELIRENVTRFAQRISLASDDYDMVVDRLAERGLSGGIVYDALIARAAEKAKVERLLTLNPGDFKRAWPESESIIAAP